MTFAQAILDRDSGNPDLESVLLFAHNVNTALKVQR